MDEEKNQSNTVPVSIGTVVMGLLLYTVLIALTFTGVGFYLRSQTAQDTQIAGLCSQLAKAYEYEIEATKTNTTNCQLQLEKYETFLVSVGMEPTMSLPSKLKKNQGQGGGP